MALKIWTGATDGTYSTAGNWFPSGVPVALDEVLIQGSVSITAGLNQSAVSLDNFIVDPSYSGTIGGLSTGYLQITASEFVFAGTGKCFIDLSASAINAQVNNTGTPTAGAYSLYLKGSALTALTVRKGSVALAGLPGETSSVTTANIQWLTSRSNDSNVLLGSGVTNTTVNQTGGTGEIRMAATTVNVTGGTLTTNGSGAIATLNVDGGTVYPNSTGTITTLNADAGTIDFMRSLAARTVTTLATTGRDAVVLYDPAFLTVTNKLAPSAPVKVTIAKA